MWINGKLVYHYQGQIKPPNQGNEWSTYSTMQFGIYRMAKMVFIHIHKSVIMMKLDMPKNKCSKLKLEELGYDCKKLENQKIEIDTLYN